jgi:hypothetical protein
MLKSTHFSVQFLISKSVAVLIDVNVLQLEGTMLPNSLLLIPDHQNANMAYGLSSQMELYRVMSNIEV